MQSPQVTVAIVAYQSRDYMQACVDALAAQSFTDFECVIVDNASTDGGMDALRPPDARFRVQRMGTNLGFAAANNVAAFASSAPWFATLNPDTRADPAWLAALMSATARWPDAASFGSTQISLEDPDVLDGVGDVWHAAGIGWRGRFLWPASAVPPEGEVFGPCAAAALYRRDLFVALGGFDERFFCYCEDVDLAYRLRLAGWSAVQVADAVVRHAGSGISGRTSEFTVFHGHRNRVWTWVKNTPGLWLWILLPYHLAYNAAMWWSSRKIGSLGVMSRAYVAAVKGLPAVWQDRRRVQKTRKASLQSLFRAMAWLPQAPLRRDIVRRLAEPRPPGL